MSSRLTNALNQLDVTLSHFSPFDRVIVAYSGGADSHVLLHWLASAREQLAVPLQAIHVQHNLQPQALDWVRHCRQVCQGLAIPLRVLTVDARVRTGESPEQAARRARYRVLKQEVERGDLLLTAHHCDDQAETVLLQLLRGAGVRGLSAMPALVRFGPGRLARPLLRVPRQCLRRYAQRHQLHWIEDPSNLDTAMDRNFVRAQIMPLLETRWPATASSVARSAGHCAEAEQLLDELARLDSEGLTDDFDSSLAIQPLLGLSTARRRNLLRQWLAWQGHGSPPAVVLKRIFDEVLGAAQDRQPVVAWGTSQLRRHKGRLYVLFTDSGDNRHFRSDIAIQQTVDLPDGGQVRLGLGKGVIDPRRVRSVRLQVGYRRGGERLRVRSKGRMRSLKNLFQEADVPPWERPRIPILFADEEVVAVAGYWVNDEFACSSEGPEGLLFEWYPWQPSATL